METEINKLAETFDKVLTLTSEKDATVKKSPPPSPPKRKSKSKPENGEISKRIRQGGRRRFRIPKISKDILLERLGPSAFLDAEETETEHTGAIEAVTEDPDSEVDSSYDSADSLNEGVVSYRSKPRQLRCIKKAIKKKEEEMKQQSLGAPPRPPTPPSLFTKPLELNEDDLNYLELKSKGPADNQNVIRQTTEEYQRNRKMMIDMNRERAEARRQRAICRKARSKRNHDESEITL